MHIFKGNIWFIAVAILFAFLSFPLIDVPFYWDEIWVYAPALTEMAEIGRTLLPGVLDAELSRGHPLLFHFLGGIFINLFGDELTTFRLYALLISGSTLFATWLIAKKLTNIYGAISICALLAFQNIFRAQSVLILPEMMLTLWGVLATYFYLEKRYWLMVLFSSFAILTKESGIIICLALGIVFLIENRHQILKFKVPPKTYLFFFPLIPLGLFFSNQYFKEGWIFFPEHLGYIDTSFGAITNKIARYFSNGHIYWGRNSLLIISFFSGIYILFKKTKIEKKQQTFLWVWLVFGILYHLFLGVNFFSDRYILAYIPFLLIGTGLIFFIALHKRSTFLMLLMILLAPVFVLVGSKSTISDHTLGFENMARVNKEAIDFVNSNYNKEDKVACHFLMLSSLRIPEAKFVKTPYLKASGNFNTGEKIRIFSRMEGKEEYQKLKSDTAYFLKKRFEKEGAWVEIYERKD